MPTKARSHNGQQRAASRRAYDQSPGRRADHLFYNSARWLSFRRWFLGRHPLCAHCTEATSATEVHHIMNRKDHPELVFVESNCLPLCRPCHSRISMTETHERMNGRGGKGPVFSSGVAATARTLARIFFSMVLTI